MLDHERLDVYKCALDFVSSALAMIERFPRGHGWLADQFRRSAMSIPLNIAEASGKISVADRRNFYAIARGSSMECSACLDMARKATSIPGAELDSARTLIIRIVSMLTKLCRHT